MRGERGTNARTFSKSHVRQAHHPIAIASSTAGEKDGFLPIQNGKQNTSGMASGTVAKALTASAPAAREIDLVGRPMPSARTTIERRPKPTADTGSASPNINCG